MRGVRPLRSLQFLTEEGLSALPEGVPMGGAGGSVTLLCPMGEGGGGQHRLQSVMSLSPGLGVAAPPQAMAGAPDMGGTHRPPLCPPMLPYS